MFHLIYSKLDTPYQWAKCVLRGRERRGGAVDVTLFWLSNAGMSQSKIDRLSMLVIPDSRVNQAVTDRVLNQLDRIVDTYFTTDVGPVFVDCFRTDT